MDRHSVLELLLRIMQLLLDGKYFEVEQLTNGKRYPASELERAMESHYEKITMPPANEMANVSIIFIHPTDSDISACAVTADFWVEGNGRSDLSIECTFNQFPGQPLSVQIDNLHVM